MKNSTPSPLPAAWAPSRSFAPPARRRVTQPHGSAPSRTRQEFKNDCDINRILSTYQRTGALNHFAKFSGSYGDFSACDLQTAQNLLIRARSMFDALPSSLRKLVSTPEGFLDFVQDPANADKMAEYGLTTPRQTVPSGTAGSAASTTPPTGRESSAPPPAPGGA